MAGVSDLLTGAVVSQDEDKKAREFLDKVANGYDGVIPPELLPILMQRQQWQGDVAPETIGEGRDLTSQPVDFRGADVVDAGRSAMEGVATDPRLRDQQMASLAALKELADNGGMNATDRANMARMQNEVSQADRGRREAIDMDMQRRGMGGGSGNALLSKLVSGQASTDRAAQQGLDIQGMAQDRALRAMMEGGNLAGSVRNQDFGEQSQAAQARDAIAKFNAANRNTMNQFNAGVLNQGRTYNADRNMQAQQFNIGKGQDTERFNAGQRTNADEFNHSGRQQVSDRNTDLANNEKMYNQNTLLQQRFGNTMNVAGAKSDVAKTGLSYWQDQSGKKRDAYGRVIEGGAKVAASAVSDERCKTDIKEVKGKDLDSFLASLSPKKFKYKDEADGEGDFTGVMAQDLMKTPLGAEVVISDDDGKMGYDIKKMIGVQLAAIKHLADKVNKKGKA